MSDLIQHIPMACSVCWSPVANDQNIVALKWSMITLLCVVAFVLFFFIKFLFKIRRNEKMQMKA